MEPGSEIKILRIYVSNTDKFKHQPLYEMVVYAAKHYGLAGATVQKGIMGFGASSKVHSIKFWELTEKLPVVVEIVDTADKIDCFTDHIKPWFAKLRYGCLITAEKADVVFYKQGTKKGFFNF